MESIIENKVDFVNWKINQIFINLNGDPIAKTNSTNEFIDFISIIPDFALRQAYIDQVSKLFKLNKKILIKLLDNKLKLNTEQTEEKVLKLPDSINQKEFEEFGFYEDKNCYYFAYKDTIFKCSNFIVKPLFHIYSKSDNKRIIEIVNEYNRNCILDVSSKAFVSLDLFQQCVINEGNYLFFGTKIQFFKVLQKINNNFPVCNELKTMGWQREGFYAFSNKIFSDVVKNYDEYGMIEFNDKKYFSPAFSVIYKDFREDDDEYENDRYFIHRENKNITFLNWANRIKSVYGNNGLISIAFFIASLFKDLIYNKYKIFPHLFLFGEKQSGKSQLGWSLSNIFFNQLPPFNLNSGTQVGFFRRLARVKNAISYFEEYTNDVDEKRFQSLKAAYDGVGYEKGKKTQDNRTEITRVNSSCVIAGQYLPTRDDNALFTRSILLSFSKRNFTKNEMMQFDELKALEETGFSNIICEILKFRVLIEQKFARMFSEIYDSIKQYLIDLQFNFEERIIRNFVTILTPLKIISESSFELPFQYVDFELLCKNEIIKLSNQISSSEALANFWKTIEFLLDNKQIQYGADIDISVETEVTIYTEKNQTKVILFPSTTDILYVRFNKIHPLYMEAHRKQTGKNGIDLTSLMHYINNHTLTKIGAVRSHRFTNSNTSAYALQHDRIIDCFDVNFRRDSNILNDEANVKAQQSDIVIPVSNETINLITDELPF